MKLIESKAEYIPQEDGLDGIYKQIELCGRTCYKSEDKITEGSAKGFVDRMIKSSHTAMLEHGTVYLELPNLGHKDYTTELGVLVANITTPYTKIVDIPDGHNDSYTYALTTNMRVIEEIPSYLQEYKDTLFQYLCSPTEFHEKRYTMRFTCSRAISHELVRSRTMSFAQESQRYINYSKERHGGEITFIKPTWLNCPFEDITESELCYLANQYPQEVAARRFIASLVESKYAYMTLLQKGCTPQQARDVLPNATKTEIVVTGFASDWRHLLDLRLFEKTGKVSPDMKNIMQEAQKAMQEAGIWEDIMSKPSKFE